MWLRKAPDLTYADVTPRSVYLHRRKFLRAMGVGGATASLGKGLFDLAWPPHAEFAGTKIAGLAKSAFSTTEKQNSYDEVTHYNNFYEFGTDKTEPARNSKNFNISPWSVSIEGEVKKPRKFTMDEILKIAPLEERIYRHRCVEAWSIVVPWIGFSFSKLINLVEPTPKAQFVAFQSYFNYHQMPEAKYAGIDFPYVEGLRMDEAMNPLALLCLGMYGETLPNQDGAPVRMVLPWKYGIKSIKSLVKIRFQSTKPPAPWNRLAPHDIASHSNLNPLVP